MADDFETYLNKIEKKIKRKLNELEIAFAINFYRAGGLSELKKINKEYKKRCSFERKTELNKESDNE